MDSAQRLWTRCSEILQTQVPESTWRTWFEPARPVAGEGDTLTLAVPSTLVKERIESRFLPIIENAVVDVTGVATPIRLEVRTDPVGASEYDLFDAAGFAGAWSATGTTAPGENGATIESSHDNDYFGASPVTRTGGRDSTASVTAGGGGGGGGGAPGKRPGAGSAAGATGGGMAGGAGDGSGEDAGSGQTTSDRYTFDAFVIGSSNRFAHAAALSVAETPAKAYNPLFIHGEAGLGKTHLLHAIGNYVREHYPSYNVTYVSTETFMNEFVDAIRRNTTAEFKRRYRECDVLLVDDIQFMEGKESLQEEFFHTFNSLHGASKQIVITSDRPPKAIATLENRLRSRFLSGLITDVQPPDLETRLAILRKKASMEGATSLSDEVMEFIATHVTDNIRELEGAFIRASAFASLSGTPMDRHLAEEVLSDIVTDKQTRPITPAIILEMTSKAFGFSEEELCSPSRRRPLTTARQVAMYLCRELTDYSYPAIGAEFGGRDHTTVIHAVSKVSAMMMQRKQIYEQVNNLIHLIKSGG